MQESFAVFVWALRIALPCVLFWITFGPRLELPWLGRGRCHGREVMLLHRRALLALAEASGEKAPDCLRNLRMVDEDSAPQVFKDVRRESDSRGDTAERRDRKEKAERKDKEKSKASSEKTRVHLERLVNFVAFNRLRQQRVFLLRESDIPPPPPQARPGIAELGVGDATTGDGLRANMEAAHILRGALQTPTRAARVAKNLSSQFEDLSVEVSPVTYELMVEAALRAKDLLAVKGFVSRMEAAGLIPNEGVLDRVMELYLENKAECEDQKDSEPVGAATQSRTADPGSTDASHGAFAGTRATPSEDEACVAPLAATTAAPILCSAHTVSLSQAISESEAQMVCPPMWGWPPPMVGVRCPPPGEAVLDAGAAETASSLLASRSNGGSCPDSLAPGMGRGCFGEAMPRRQSSTSAGAARSSPAPFAGPAFSVPDEFRALSHDQTLPG